MIVASVFGYVGDSRAMSEAEIQQMQCNQAAAMRNACPTVSQLLGMAQYQPPQRPLDERFADFKRRLAAALDRRKGAA